MAHLPEGACLSLSVEMHGAAWDGKGPISGEKEKPYARVLLDGVAPFNLDSADGPGGALGALPSRPELSFERLAGAVFGPMLEVRQR